MLGFYIFAAVLGGGLLLLSQLAGDHDANGGAGAGDHGHGPDVGVHGPAELLLGFFRPRNLIFFLAAFGISGTLLTLTGSVAPLALGLSVIMGLAAMALTHGVFTWLRRSDTATDTVAAARPRGGGGGGGLPARPGGGRGGGGGGGGGGVPGDGGGGRILAPRAAPASTSKHVR